MPIYPSRPEGQDVIESVARSRESPADDNRTAWPGAGYGTRFAKLEAKSATSITTVKKPARARRAAERTADDHAWKTDVRKTGAEVNCPCHKRCTDAGEVRERGRITRRTPTTSELAGIADRYLYGVGRRRRAGMTTWGALGRRRALGDDGDIPYCTRRVRTVHDERADTVILPSVDAAR